ncbi:MAG: DUF565 domain-containing protein [Cyanobacteriota bacterium]|nr:DUF565 domain-containing protein [Cyanobacteriota bacterium]
MQNTRFSTLISAFFGRIGKLLRNPWRRLSLVILGFLFGFFLGTAVSTVAGQLARLDITLAAILVLMTEALSWLVYTRNGWFGKTPPIETLNALKIGLMYSLYVEAFKLGS